jgi:hypothetical protein
MKNKLFLFTLCLMFSGFSVQCSERELQAARALQVDGLLNGIGLGLSVLSTQQVQDVYARGFRDGQQYLVPALQQCHDLLNAGDAAFRAYQQDIALLNQALDSANQENARLNQTVVHLAQRLMVQRQMLDGQQQCIESQQQGLVRQHQTIMCQYVLLQNRKAELDLLQGLLRQKR